MRSRAIFWAGVVVVLAFNLGVRANYVGINLISPPTHHVYGSAGWTNPDTYDYTDSVPVSGTASGVGRDGYLGSASSSAGDFTVEAYVIGDYASRESLAECTYLFNPTVSDLTITFTGEGLASGGGWEAVAGFELWDVTDYPPIRILIDSYEWMGDTEGDPFPTSWIVDEEDYDYLVDPSHLYELRIYAETGFGSEGGEFHSLLNVSITPEPSTLLLFGFGGLALLRKRR